jgi:hypothetical protein
MQIITLQFTIFMTMKRVYRYTFILFVSLAAMCYAPEAQAQCPMCKMSAESNLKSGGSTGKGLNTGILYMLALPYTLVGTLGFIWWRNNRRKEEDEVEVLP